MRIPTGGEEWLFTAQSNVSVNGRILVREQLRTLQGSGHRGAEGRVWTCSCGRVRTSHQVYMEGRGEIKCNSLRSFRKHHLSRKIPSTHRHCCYTPRIAPANTCLCCYTEGNILPPCPPRSLAGVGKHPAGRARDPLWDHPGAQHGRTRFMRCDHCRDKHRVDGEEA